MNNKLTLISKLLTAALAVAICSGLPTLLAAAPTGDIVRDGKPNATIITAREPSRVTRLAAEELQSYIRKLTGSELPIASEPQVGDIRIYVGPSAETAALGLEVDDLKHGAYRIASGDDWLALLGRDETVELIEPYIKERTSSEFNRVHKEWDAISGGQYYTPYWSNFGYYNESLDISYLDEMATLNAVYGYLRSLGVRWYFPGEIGEILPPQTATLPLPQIDETVRPDFDLRRFNYYYDRHGLSDDEALWNLRMGINHGQDIVGLIQQGHGMKFVHMRDEFKEAHPEYFKVSGGKPALNEPKRTGMPALASEGFYREHLQFARAVFDHYDEPMLSLDLPDGYGPISEAEPDHSMGTPERGFQGRLSDYVWTYIDRMARQLHEEYPDKMVSGLVYSGYQLPPLTIDEMSPNLALFECRWRSNFYNEQQKEYYSDLREAWLEKLPSGQWFIWDYYLHADPRSQRRAQGRPFYFTRQIADDLKSLKGISRGDSIEVYRHPNHTDHDYDWSEYAIQHLNVYVTSRYWWDADQDLDALLDEFYELYYGPAQEEMRAFIEYSEENWPNMSSNVESIDRALELLAAAQAAAPGDSVYAERIQITADYVDLIRSHRDKLALGRQGPTVTLPVVDGSELLIDGTLDDAFWSDIPEHELVNVVDGSPTEPKTRVRLAWLERDELAVAIRVEEPDMVNLNDPGTAADDSAIWNGDFVELFIETPAHAYYQLAVSPSGLLLDLNRSGRINTGWSSEATVATHRDTDGWTVEMIIPAAGANAHTLYPDEGVSGDPPTADQPWYFNIGRKRQRGDEFELTTLSPVGRKHFHDTLKFGTLQVAE